MTVQRLTVQIQSSYNIEDHKHFSIILSKSKIVYVWDSFHMLRAERTEMLEDQCSSRGNKDVVNSNIEYALEVSI